MFQFPRETQELHTQVKVFLYTQKITTLRFVSSKIRLNFNIIFFVTNCYTHTHTHITWVSHGGHMQDSRKQFQFAIEAFSSLLPAVRFEGLDGNLVLLQTPTKHLAVLAAAESSREFEH